MGLYHTPQAQEVDTSGDNLAGGLLYFYEVGTTTLKTVYSDKALTVAHSNPVVADAAGRWDPIYTNGAYKVKLADSDDTEIWTEDDISFGGAGDLYSATTAITVTTPITASHEKNLLRCTGTISLNLLAVASATEGFAFAVKNDGTGIVTIDPNGSEQINDSTTIKLAPGDGGDVICDGSEWTFTGHEALKPEAKGADIASAATLDISAVDGNYFDVTGTTTITSITTTGFIGSEITLHFDGALTLTHHATDLFLHADGSNITTAAGDEAVFREYASGDYRLISYSRASGLPIVNPPLILPRSHLTGLGLSQDTDTDHDILIAIGEARDSTNTVNISLTSAITKQIDATWAAGDDAGGLSSSLSAPANSTSYHVFAIIVGGSVDVGFDTSVTAANLVADHSATAYRRIGSVLTDGSANIIDFVQNGDTFIWDVSVDSVTNTSDHTSAQIGTLDVPTGVIVEAIINVAVNDASSGGNGTLVTQLNQTDTAPSATAAPGMFLGTNTSAYRFASAPAKYFTNTSGQVRYRSNNPSVDTNIITIGWIDRRGRDD